MKNEVDFIIEVALANTFQYTNQLGWNAIRAQSYWRFLASRPNDPDRPRGAYFTDIEPSAVNLRLLHKKIRVPREKREYVFWFTGRESLIQLFGGTGRDRYIYFSPIDYVIRDEARKKHGGLTGPLSETFP